MSAKSHWEHIYRTKRPDQVSWFEAEATLSLNLIELAAPSRDSSIIDVGGGASRLVDGLVARGYDRVTVLDLSQFALLEAQRRLSHLADSVAWRVEDILTADLPAASFDVWHDRAVFHFLTEAADRAQYVRQVRHAVRAHGHVLVATFAEDGPTRCSGLNVARYSADELHSEFGRDFRLVESRHQDHHTPWGTRQAFTYCLCRYEPRVSTRHAA